MTTNPSKLIQAFGIKHLTFAKGRMLLAAGVITYLASTWLMLFERITLSSEPSYQYGSGNPTLFGIISVGYSAIIVAAFSEEFGFRAVLYGIIGRKKWWADILQAFAFSASHGDCGRNVTLFVLGLLLSYCFRRWGLLGSISVHAGYNIGAVLAAYVWYIIPSV
jgi:membrane protease YdiL (CAAX protease family)